MFKKFIFIILFVSTFFTVDASFWSSFPTTEISAQKFLTTHKIEGISGRIVRGTPNYFENLKFDSHSKLVFLMGPDGLEQLGNKSGYEMLLMIGYTPEYIEHFITQGSIVKLALFPPGLDARVATWGNLLALAGEAYPEIHDDLLRHKEALELLAFESFEAAAGYRFGEVQKIGLTDERYMTYDRYLASSRGLLETRSFLFFTLRLNELFSGDGYTYDFEGNRGVKEYVTLASKLNEFKDFLLLHIEAELELATVH